MTNSHDQAGNGLIAPARRLRRALVGLAALAVVVGGTSLAAAATGGAGAGKFAASFDARAVGDPTIQSCRALGAEGRKIEAQYEGTFAITADERQLAARFSLEIVFDRSTGFGTAEGQWQLADPPSEAGIVGRGELIAVVNTTEPPDPDLEPPDPDAEPPDPDLELDGVLIGLLEPPDPDMPAQRLVGNFTATLGDGATFPHLKVTVGDPSVGDPSVGDPSSAAVLLPAIKC